MRQRVQPVAALEMWSNKREQPSKWTSRSVDPSHWSHRANQFPTKKNSAVAVDIGCTGLPSSHTHTSWRPPHLMRPPPTATLVAALPEKWAIISEPSGLA